jgi:hypothetical protein
MLYSYDQEAQTQANAPGLRLQSSGGFLSFIALRRRKVLPWTFLTGGIVSVGRRRGGRDTIIIVDRDIGKDSRMRHLKVKGGKSRTEDVTRNEEVTRKDKWL